MDKPISFDAIQERLGVNVTSADPKYKLTTIFAEVPEADFLRNQETVSESLSFHYYKMYS